MGIVGKKILGFVVGSILTEVILNAGNNLIEGKTITGKKRKKAPKNETTLDWKGNVILGKADYRVV